MQANLTVNQQIRLNGDIREIEDKIMRNETLGFFDTTTPYENMPGRCFIGERNLDQFIQQNYCYDGKFLYDG